MTRWATLPCLVFLASVEVIAQQSEGFSGVWKPTNPPGRHMWHVDQSPRGVTLKVMVDDREVSVTTWTFGGPPTVRGNAVGSNPAETTATLLNRTLIFRGTMATPQGETVPFEETWQLDDDGNLRVHKQADTGTALLRNDQMFARAR